MPVYPRIEYVMLVYLSDEYANLGIEQQGRQIRTSVSVRIAEWGKSMRVDASCRHLPFVLLMVHAQSSEASTDLRKKNSKCSRKADSCTGCM